MPHPFRSSEIKCLMLQLLAGVAFMHENWIIHRDL
jgi:cell division cycle 2-like protein